MADPSCTHCGSRIPEGASCCDACGKGRDLPASELTTSQKLKEVGRLMADFKRTHDESVAARIRELNASLQDPAGQQHPPAAARPRAILTKTRTAALQLLGAVLFAVLLIRFCSGLSGRETQHLQALKATAVQSVKNDFEPAPGMLSLNPDTSTGGWFAVKNFGVYECRGECVVVVYSVNVMPPGATEAKRVEFKWLYDTSQSRAVPVNTEARTYFEPSQ